MLKKLIKDERQRALALFAIKAVGIYIIWFISYDFFIAPSGKVDACLNERVAKEAGGMLTLIGLEGGTLPGDRQTIVTICGDTMVGVGNPCNGLELFALFAGFILCFPGAWKHKAWFIPAGCVAIHIINSMRAASLAVIQYKAPEYLDFNHHYTFTIVVYSLIFFLWVIWTNIFSKKKDTIENKKLYA